MSRQGLGTAAKLSPSTGATGQLSVSATLHSSLSVTLNLRSQTAGQPMGPGLSAESKPFRSAERDADLFRGQVMGSLARAEQAISRVLVLHHATGKPLPNLLSQKMKRLSDLAVAGGPLASQAEALATPLTGLGPYVELRNVLAHGACEVSLTEAGQAVAVFRVLRTRDRAPMMETLAMTRAQMQSLLARIEAAVAAVVDVLEPAGRVGRAADLQIVVAGAPA